MTQKELQGIQTKETILEEAQKLFQRNGYRGTALSMIAKRAGIRVSTILYHFESKKNLFLQVYDRALVHSWMYEEYLKKEGPVLDLVFESIWEMRQRSAGGVGMSMASQEFIFEESGDELEHEAYTEGMREFFATLYQRGIDRGEVIPVDAHAWGEMATTFCVGLFMEKDGLGEQTGVERRLRFFLNHFRAK